MISNSNNSLDNSQLLPPYVVKSISYKVGQRIKYYREKKKYSQEILGLITGLSTTQISYCEDGVRMITLEKLFEIALALGISASDLVDKSKFAKDKEIVKYVNFKHLRNFDLKDL